MRLSIALADVFRGLNAGPQVLTHSNQHKLESAQAILWMLEILDTHRQDKDLCLLAAKTVLKVVDNH